MRTLEQLKHDVLTAIDANREKIISIGETIWKNPETGYREVKTAKLAAETLKSLGLKVRENIALTGLRADLPGQNPGPVLAILGEMDALLLPTHPEADPVTGAVHVCGHNSHITGVLGAAIGLCGADAAKELSGTVAFLGTPAEECIEIDYRSKLIDAGKIQFLSGKQEMIRCGAFDDVDLSYMLHVGGYGVWDGNGFLIKKITFHGKSCHAAGPAGGINAMNALTLAQNAIALLRETLNPEDRVHGIITGGGDVINIIPDSARMEYMLRSNTVEKLHSLNERFDRAVTHAAQALGAEAEIRTLPGDMPLFNDRKLVELYRQTVTEQLPDVKIGGITFNPGSTDMGDVSTILPALHGNVAGSSGACHSIDFRICDPESAYVMNAKLLALMAVELLYGDAEKAKEIAGGKAEKLRIPDYLNLLQNFRKG